MRFVSGLTAFISAMALVGSAFAATVTATQGQVLVNHGNGYQAVVGSTEADPGATVVANPGGSAQIMYDDGCAVAVQPGSVYTVLEKSPCKTSWVPGVDNYTLAIIGGVAIAGGAALFFLTEKAISP